MKKFFYFEQGETFKKSIHFDSQTTNLNHFRWAIPVLVFIYFIREEKILPAIIKLNKCWE